MKAEQLKTRAYRAHHDAAVSRLEHELTDGRTRTVILHLLRRHVARGGSIPGRSSWSLCTLTQFIFTEVFGFWWQQRCRPVTEKMILRGLYGFFAAAGASIVIMLGWALTFHARILLAVWGVVIPLAVLILAGSYWFMGAADWLAENWPRFAWFRLIEPDDEWVLPSRTARMLTLGPGILAVALVLAIYAVAWILRVVFRAALWAFRLIVRGLTSDVGRLLWSYALRSFSYLPKPTWGRLGTSWLGGLALLIGAYVKALYYGVCPLVGLPDNLAPNPATSE